MDLLDALLNQVLVFVLVLTRLSGLIMIAPGYGANLAPFQVRALLAITIALLISPLHGASSVSAVNVLHLAIMLLHEIGLGMILGAAVLILITGLHISGQVISQTGGLQIADVVDPSFEGSMPILSKLFELVALAVLFIVGGHREIMNALLHSFERVPPGSMYWTSSWTHLLSETMRQSMEVGLRAAAPVTLALLLSTLVMGIISRTVPQLNILAVGFGLNSLVLLAVFSFAVGAAAWMLSDQTTIMVDAFRSIFDQPPTTPDG
jgi:flagellar biosynthesis protein FliR